MLYLSPVTAQKTFIRFDPDYCVPGSLKISDVSVADQRLHITHELGFLSSGIRMEQYTEQDLTTALTGFYRKDVTAIQAPRLLIVLHHFYAYQYASGLSRNISFAYEADYFLSDAVGQYRLAAHVDSTFHLHATFLSKSGWQSINEALCGIYSGIDTTLSGQAYTYAEALAFREERLKQYPVITTGHYEEGAYASWTDFLQQRPDRQYSIAQKAERPHLYTTKENGQLREAALSHCKVIVFNSKLYYIINDHCLEFSREQNNFISLSVSGRDVLVSNAPKVNSVLYTKSTGTSKDDPETGLTVKRKYKEQYRYRINIANGTLSPMSSHYQLLKTKIKE